MMSHKKSLLLDINRQNSRRFYVMKNALTLILIFSMSFTFAQDKDKALQKSNDFVYEGNVLVKKDFIASEKEYRKALSKKANNINGAYNLGNAYYEKGNFDEALLRHIEASKLAVTKEQKHKAFHNIGNALMQQKMCKEAVEAFKNALRSNPTDEETRYNLVVAQECAREQQNNEDKNKDKEEEDKKDENKDDDKKKDDENKKDDGDEDKKEGDDKKDKDGKPKDEKDDKKEGDPKNKKEQQQPQPGKLSPQQVKNLLEAMSNEEKKVQKKINAKKAKGKKTKAEKDW